MIDKKSVWYETEHYEVRVGDGTDPENPGPCYHIINKQTQVPEVETKIWPQAKFYCNQIEEAYNAEIKVVADKETPPLFQH